jgi:uncharacterized membrane protein
MAMEITIVTNELSKLDKQILGILAGAAEMPVSQPTTAPAAKATPKAAPVAQKAAPAPEPEPEPEAAEEDLVGSAPVMADAVALATQLVSEGKSADVKKVLADNGVKRVSELSGDQIAAFVSALS